MSVRPTHVNLVRLTAKFSKNIQLKRIPLFLAQMYVLYSSLAPVFPNLHLTHIQI